jgi:O-antigen/teichoic acid export membrane protein
VIKKLIDLSRRDFSRNVALVFGGALGAQLITFAASPVLTRLYGPEAFGLFGTIVSIAALIGPIATLAYPVAMTLPKRSSDAKKIATISFCMAMLISLISLPLILLTKHQISILFNLEDYADYLLFLPLMIFFLACLEISQQWTIRERRFAVMASVTFTHSIIVNLLKVLAGLLYPFGVTLILISIFASALQTVMFTLKQIKIKRLIGEILSQFRWRSLIKTAKKYDDFPFYRMPQVLVLSISQNLPLLMLASLSSIVSAGQYGLARTVMVVPVMLLGNSVASVFYPRINQAILQGENTTLFLKKSTLVLGAIGILPFGLLFFIGPWLFVVVFGEPWLIAGNYASWLSLFFYFSLLSKPALAAVAPLNVQKNIFHYELVSMLLKMASFLIGIFLLASDEKAVMLFSIAGAICYLFITLWIIKKSKTSDH